MNFSILLPSFPYKNPTFSPCFWYLCGVTIASDQDRLTWPWWQLDEEELLLEAPTALPRDALLALVLMDEVRKAEGNVGEDGKSGTTWEAWNWILNWENLKKLTMKGKLKV
jgi:hypothetical protein